MGQKVRPTGFRVGVMEDWSSRWYASKAESPSLVVEDELLRRFIKKKYKFAGIPKIEIERTRDEVKVLLHTARPGIIIGRKGQEVDQLRDELQAMTGRRININIQEVGKPELSAQLVAENIAEQLEKRASFRRVIKRSLEASMAAGALGVKIEIAGRLGGAEMARREKAIVGQVPLQTLRIHIEYGFTEARTTYGAIGVKVWINHGLYDHVKMEGDDYAFDAKAGQVPQKPARKN
jgi:small subunit ribosomal protein S3